MKLFGKHTYMSFSMRMKGWVKNRVFFSWNWVQFRVAFDKNMTNMSPVGIGGE